MEPNPIIFRDLTFIFLAAVLGGLLAWRLRRPLILGFVLGGICISPFTPGPRLTNVHELFAEIGVVIWRVLLPGDLRQAHYTRGQAPPLSTWPRREWC